jgi:hypothetical protein
MDFDIGNILYIVITIVAVVVGLMRKKKKPAGGQDKPAGQKQPGFMENLERLLTMGQEEPVVRDLMDDEEDLPYEENVVHSQEDEPVSGLLKAPNIMDEYDRIMNSNRSSDFDVLHDEGESMNGAMEVSDLDNESGSDYFDIVNDFDGRSAIIYAAIINRIEY